MFKQGHLGVSMLVFGPVGYALVARGLPELAAITGLVMAWFTMLPDIDHRLPIVEHRGPTHSLLFAALIGGESAGQSGQASKRWWGPSGEYHWRRLASVSAR